ncbi:hypothetical protein J8L86_15820 [Shewanella sp. MMG014]|uniref:hypothetical protein n=1 Tax=Shewanella sp. MMG014 TaxID=2822691 RepID=UPI001B386543|nr:hypothetical protein [Shewanella sp. MMG014]MBQ4891322.1 hypothetical protein [Shewanella sp. MMG014]
MINEFLNFYNFYVTRDSDFFKYLLDDLGWEFLFMWIISHLLEIEISESGIVVFCFSFNCVLFGFFVDFIGFYWGCGFVVFLVLNSVFNII